MRKRSDIPPEVDPIPPATVIRQERKYQLITPLYGGGVTSAEPDPITVVRTTEIRGHLRFWWRACRGGQYGTLEAIKRAEDALWGTAGTKQGGGPSQVQVEVAEYSVGDPHASFDIAPSYAVFPLRQTPNKPLYVDVSFTLIIYFPSAQQQEVEAALRMWEIFGGIGARTRRGFGALRLISVDGVSNSDLPGSTKEEAKTWVQYQLEQCVVQGTYPPSMPHLTHSTMFKITDSSEDVMDVWDDLIEQLKDFRQHRQRPNNPRHPGRSIWPEPSEIRRFTNQSLPAHENPPIPDPPIRKFPRAVFGLPIIFQFKDRDRHDPDNKERDPRNTVLRLDISERLASPIILKPLACQNGKYVGLAVILDGTGVDEDRLILKTQEGTKEEHVKYAFDSTESLVVGEDRSGNPIKIDSSTNALQAFLKYLEGI